MKAKGCFAGSTGNLLFYKGVFLELRAGVLNRESNRDR
jgi:hypothetical protein